MKTLRLVSLIVLISLLLVACGPKATPAPAPAAPAPAAAEPTAAPRRCRTDDAPRAHAGPAADPGASGRRETDAFTFWHTMNEQETPDLDGGGEQGRR